MQGEIGQNSFPSTVCGLRSLQVRSQVLVVGRARKKRGDNCQQKNWKNYHSFPARGQ